MARPINVLLVEDEPHDAEFILRELRRGGFVPSHRRVDSEVGLRAALAQQPWDVIICDFSLPSFTGMEALQIVRAHDVDVPFVLVSGNVGEQTAVAAMKAGAHDYLMKDNLARLTPAIDRELREAATRRERKQIDRVLQGIVECSNDPIISTTLDGTVTTWNRSAEEVFGYSAREMIGQPVGRIIPADKAAEADDILARLRADEAIRQWETTRVTQAGHSVPVSLTVSPIQDAAGRLTGISNIVRDITARKQAEAALHAWQQELELRVRERTAELEAAHRQLQAANVEHRRLELEIARAIEREQERLGHELHDGLGQQLTGIGYMMSALQAQLAKKNSESARALQKLQDLVRQTVEEARQLARGFYPVELERHGLLVALEEVISKKRLKPEVTCVVESDGHPAAAMLKGPPAIQLFRIAQEATHNALKHSDAQCITIRLATDANHLILTVRDDGAGLPAGLEQAAGMGLRIMQYRAETIGGKLTIENEPPAGATVRCVVPLSSLAGSPGAPASPAAAQSNIEILTTLIDRVELAGQLPGAK